MKRFLAFDGISSEYEEFETPEEAQEWLEERFLEPGEGYHEDTETCKIYELKQTVSCVVVDSKENYKYEHEEDIPEGDKEAEAWPYSPAFDEIWKHKFVTVNCIYDNL